MIVMTIKHQGGRVSEQHFQSLDGARDSLLSIAMALGKRNVGFTLERAIGSNLPWLATLGEVPEGEVRSVDLVRRTKQENQW